MTAGWPRSPVRWRCELRLVAALLGVAPQAASTVARSTVPAAPDSVSVLLVGMRFLYSKMRERVGSSRHPCPTVTPETRPRLHHDG